MISCKEDTEAVLLTTYLRAHGYLFTHVANELLFWCPAPVRALAIRMGFCAGFPDYVICLKRYRVVFLELKRVRGGKPRANQQLWLDKLLMCGQIVMTAYGAQDAIKQIEENENAKG